MSISPVRARGAVTWRSLLLGFAGVLFICTLTPYNNYVVNNTDFVGNHLPIGLLLFFLLFIMLINAPLSRWAPRFAMSNGEMAVALGMGLVGCALPSVGLMRYLPGHLTGFWHLAAQNRDYLELLQTLNLPDWMFPTFASAGSELAARGNDPIVRDYVGRVAVDEDTFLTHLRAVPWWVWARPAAAWGIFLAGLYGAILCISAIFRHQFVENERLPFPLASVYLSVIETPQPGRAFNSLFSTRSFWIAFGVVFILHAINALHTYYPKYCPGIPLQFNLDSVLAEEPWRYTEWDFKFQRLYFTIIGIFFFVQTKVAFSLWFVFILIQVARMMAGAYHSEISEPMQFDQLFGAVIPFGIAILWVARHHLLTVLRQMLRGARAGEAQGRYLPYSVAGWGLVCSLGVLVAWLMVAGASLVGAALAVLMLMWLYMVLIKIVAETGLLYVLIPVRITQPWDFAVGALPASAAPRTTLSSYFFASLFSGIFTHDLREAPPVFVTHAMRVADGATYQEQRATWRRAIPFTIAIVLALAVAYLAAGAAMLYTDYTYAATLDRGQAAPICWWGAQGMPQWIVLEPTLKYSRPPLTDAHDRWLHFGVGAGVTSLLSVLRLRYAGWPLHPVGFLMVYTWGLRQIWFSIFVGWLLKAAMVRFGGARMFSGSRNFFIGLAIGEAAAAAFWLSISLVRLWMGLDYHAIRLLPF